MPHIQSLAGGSPKDMIGGEMWFPAHEVLGIVRVGGEATPPRGIPPHEVIILDALGRLPPQLSKNHEF